MIRRLRFLAPVLFIFLALSGCFSTGANISPGNPGSAPTVVSFFVPTERVEIEPETTGEAVTTEPGSLATGQGQPYPQGSFSVLVDINRNRHPISPLIYGLSGGPREVLEALRPGLLSWGGNPSTRYNWKLGNAWNAGSDWFFQNGNYGFPDGVSASVEFFKDAAALAIPVRLAVPTLGWVAKDRQSCSFPNPDGTCGNAGGANCQDPKVPTNPERANVASDPEFIADWLTALQGQGFAPDFVAADNEPELWGYTHYDVHPECTTYEEILTEYQRYAAAVHAAAPGAQLTGPVTCCWYFYWNSAAGDVDKLAHANQDFLPWFLDQVRRGDEASGWRSLDVLDIHYYPEGLFNNQIDDETAAHRLRSTRSLWDQKYVDESWINQPVSLIPRMKTLVEKYYPGTQLGISEWNWGADGTMNGALAIADVLGIFGREGLDFAAYWRYPAEDGPGFYAFKMYTNYDDRGGRFGGASGGISVLAESSDPDRVGSYAALDEEHGQLYLILVNKQSQADEQVQIGLVGFNSKPVVQQYRYREENLHDITASQAQSDPQQLEITLPPSSITLLVLESSD